MGKMGNRRSQRRPGHDYSLPGGYFITICTTDRQCLFGAVVRGEMILNAAGQMIRETWTEIPEYYARFHADALQVMPNHIHGVLIINDVGAVPCDRPDHTGSGRPQGAAPAQPLCLSDVVARFKSLTTKRYGDGVRNAGWPPFRGRLWQRNYHDNVIEGREDLSRIREYIRNNPADWHVDESR